MIDLVCCLYFTGIGKFKDKEQWVAFRLLDLTDPNPPTEEPTLFDFISGIAQDFEDTLKQIEVDNFDEEEPINTLYVSRKLYLVSNSDSEVEIEHQRVTVHNSTKIILLFISVVCPFSYQRRNWIHCCSHANRCWSRRSS